MSIPKDIGCKNGECIKSKECNRAKIYRDDTAREVKSFGGTPEKGCGKFLPIENWYLLEIMPEWQNF